MAGGRFLICGGRTFEDRGRFNRAMREIVEREGEPSCVIEGGARGADYLGKLWAERRGIPVFECRANWQRFGKRAGHVRNGWMIEHGKPDIVIAFPGGRGTDDMCAQAAEAGLVIFRPFHEDMAAPSKPGAGEGPGNRPDAAVTHTGQGMVALHVGSAL